jgi:hypothetical protein
MSLTAGAVEHDMSITDAVGHEVEAAPLLATLLVSGPSPRPGTSAVSP